MFRFYLLTCNASYLPANLALRNALIEAGGSGLVHSLAAMHYDENRVFCNFLINLFNSKIY